jgi:hypothetical protein
MVAKITTPLSISRALNYNEKKVQKGQAECIHAGNFLQDAKELNFYNKLNRFKDRNQLNTRAKTNTLHISLNFDPSERFSKERLIDMAGIYMEKIGFGHQPYLIYQHHDAGHPHVHIVTTSIRENGQRIDTFNIGRNQSEKARKEIEINFGLVKAAGQNTGHKKDSDQLKAPKIKYGSCETKKSITNVLNEVIHQYKFTSLAQLNAVLSLYNLTADRGREDGPMYKNKGLYYRILDENGNKVGVPIKASSIYFKSTLKFLEEKFSQNEGLRLPHNTKLIRAINWVLAKKPDTVAGFIAQLRKENISTVLRRNEQGFIYGITFIDHRTKSVFNGSDLGKGFSAAAIQDRITKSSNQKQLVIPGLLEKKELDPILLKNDTASPNKKDQQEPDQIAAKIESQKDFISGDLFHQIMKNESNKAYVPYEFRRKKKKRQKPKL